MWSVFFLVILASVTGSAAQTYDRLGDRDIIVFKLLADWDTASSICQSKAMELLIIENEEESKKIAEIAMGYKPYYLWLGAKRRGNRFFWDYTAQQVNFTKWAPGQPDNANGKEDCVHLSLPDTSLWNDAPCWEQNFFICQQKDLKYEYNSLQNHLVGVKKELELVTNLNKQLNESSQKSQDMEKNLEELRTQLEHLKEENKVLSNNKHEMVDLKKKYADTVKHLEDHIAENQRLHESPCFTDRKQLIIELDKLRIELDDLVEENTKMSGSFYQHAYLLEKEAEGKVILAIFLAVFVLSTFVLIVIHFLGLKIRRKNTGSVAFSRPLIIE